MTDVSGALSHAPLAPPSTAAEQADAELVLRRVGIVGTGLIGTSIGLALVAQGIDVLLHDASEQALELACRRGAGRPWGLPRHSAVDVEERPGSTAEAQGRPRDPADSEGRRNGPTDGDQRVDHAVIAVPPAGVASILRDLQSRDLALTYSDVASVKSRPLLEAERLGCDLAAFVPAHPIAGRERGGAISAQQELFLGRAWVLCPSAVTSPRALSAARAVATACGATPLVLSPEAHDRALAGLSHVPQLVASALASALVGAADEELAVVGQGFRDTTRLAESDPALWAEIVTANRAAVRPALARVRDALSLLLTALDDDDTAQEETTRLVRAGQAGRQRLPAKHGTPSQPLTSIDVVVPDRPGELARLLTVVGAHGINVEDFTVEHSPGQPSGVVEIVVLPEVAARAVGVLTDTGWAAYQR